MATNSRSGALRMSFRNLNMGETPRAGSVSNWVQRTRENAISKSSDEKKASIHYYYYYGSSAFYWALAAFSVS
jgi:hypothetical protein